MTSLSSAWMGPYLVVDGCPFVVIGAEVHNSSSSSDRAIAESFDAVRRLGANTVLAPVAWDLFEPEEGHFDPGLIDAMIEAARRRGLRLIPLWFGTWKNAASTYVPSWIKRDSERFPRSVLRDGRRANQITPFSSAARAADARAFTALMQRIRDLDTDGTVIAVQVENEVGLLGDSRDRGPLAEEAFASDVPEDVLAAVRSDPAMPLHAEWVRHGSIGAGDWATLFPAGDPTDEAFMATAFATYIEAVAAAGRAVHDVPLFVNAWLDADSVLDGPVAVAGGKRPGDYPSGGPVMSVAAIWERMASSLDLLAVDAYIDDAGPVFESYAARRGRLLVPELRADETGVAQMFLAVGRHRATGVSPFGVDALRAGGREADALQDAFRLLRAAAAVIARNPDAGTTGFVLDSRHPRHRIPIGDVVLDIRTADDHGHVVPRYPAYGIAIPDGEHGMFVIGRGFWITLGAPEGREASFSAATMYDFEEGELVVRQQLNGDETASGTLIPFPFEGGALLPGRVIPTRIPDSGIVRLDVFTY